MATPFSFFRKHAAGMMVVMVILSMMLFTMDSIFSDQSSNLWLLGMLIGSAAFGIAGISSGRWIQWGIGGAVLGTALGLFLPQYADGGGISSDLGTFDAATIEDLYDRRLAANQFAAAVNPQAGSVFHYHQHGNYEFIFGRILEAEAERLGIDVDPVGVTEFLSMISNETLTEEQYLEIRNNMTFKGKPMNEENLQEILSEAIEARLAYQMLETRGTTLPPGPEVYWQYFKRSRVRQQIEVASLRTEDFLDQIGEPTDADVENLFAKFKNFPANFRKPGDPGFLLPPRANIAYLELDAQSVESDMDPVTDEEIQKYYEENKETPLIRSIVIPEDEEPTESASEGTPTEESSSEKTPVDGDKEDGDKEATAEADQESEKDSSVTTEEPAEKLEMQPAEKKEPAAKKDAAKEDGGSVKEATTPESKTDAKPDAKTEAKSDADAAQKADAGKKDKAQQQVVKKPAFVQDEEGKADQEKAENQADQQKEDTAKEEDAAKEDAAKTKEDANAAADPAPDQQPVDAKPAVGQEGPASLTIPDTEPGQIEEPEYEYRELDEELSGQIREILMAERVRSHLDELVNAAEGEMELLARKYSVKRGELLDKDAQSQNYVVKDNDESGMKRLRNDMAEFCAELNVELKALSDKHGFAFVETGLIHDAALRTSEEFTLGKATQHSDTPMFQQQPLIANSIFSDLSESEQNNAGLMFQVDRAVRQASGMEDSEKRFLFWVSDISPQHVPTLDEPGVRDSVVKAWKLIQTREIVETRGNELAEKVKLGLQKEGEEQQTLNSALEGETVTGKENGIPLARRISTSFSWLRNSQAPNRQFSMQPATQSLITFESGAPLDWIGTKFMETIFEEMKNDEVRVVPNFDFSVYHVVRVTKRFPTKELGMQNLRDDFAREAQMTGFRFNQAMLTMNQSLSQRTHQKWQKDLYESYGIDLAGESE